MSGTNMSRLYCNNIDCRQALPSEAFITSCSHAFCGGCIQEISSNCPACSNVINDIHKDVVKVKLPPTREWKDRVLVGLDPLDILESARSALTFYAAQLDQNEHCSQSIIKVLTQRLDDQESKKSLDMFEQDLKIKSLEKKVSDLYDELATANHYISSEKQSHQETKSQLSRLQSLYDASKQKQFDLIRSSRSMSTASNPLIASSAALSLANPAPHQQLYPSSQSHHPSSQSHHPSPQMSPNLQAQQGGMASRGFSFRRGN